MGTYSLAHLPPFTGLWEVELGSWPTLCSHASLAGNNEGSKHARLLGTEGASLGLMELEWLSWVLIVVTKSRGPQGHNHQGASVELRKDIQVLLHSVLCH